ncbi:hypothetical protein ONS95_014947 [Cadophora gregata]|uniref:uncharacterized protein n=1 Tax=Cadophora gregata TaxID=51156 RepID=UPI0026DCF1C2|nr:uncharacterized protein ONS95_014947 [Cadophora gregata]KAK0103147.1 hypothetical protein ONS96_005756 [Cadophora gregata f. sp. sojae]KAK0113251.1 hypothetical protein ONS95_014947 [Cadophora gregata]
MVPKPIGSNAQKQRLTTALKNICRDYPAGGTVIRELLQNADDAGATEARFVLDVRTHPTQNLISPSLAQYQGPALLSYNDAIFSDKDFESLSRLGDSLKLNDGATTGRFGRGFNSVYNWTDSPSIISCERLLILDPHQEWSEGGPVYDFVRDASDLSIKNHMAAYSSVMEHLDQPLNGTIIRIPLRHIDQILKSDISSISTTTAEIEEVLQNFCREFSVNGLLFMRNLTKLVIVFAGMSHEIEMIGEECIHSHKSKINAAVQDALNSAATSFHYSFPAGIRYSLNGNPTTVTNFLIQHSIQKSMDEGLRVWAKSQQLIPWVAVATQVPVSANSSSQCSLFTVLPLPVNTIQPIHIHALFSLTPDRANLHRLTDHSTQNQNPARWNQWLLTTGASVAWARLLHAVAKLYPAHSAFEKWPKSMDNKQDPQSDSLDRVTAVIQKECLEVWPTDTGYVSHKLGLLALGSESAVLKEVFREAGLPIVYVPKHLQNHAERAFMARLVSPKAVCASLNLKRETVASLSGKTKCMLVDYIFSSSDLVDHGSLEIFPFEDGGFRCLNGIQAYVHRDELDKMLFSKQKGRNLALDCLAIETQNLLKQRCGSSTLHPSIQFRSAKCLREYSMRTVFKRLCRSQNMVTLDAEASAFSANALTWISNQNVSLQNEDVKDLWLLPLSNGLHRKVVPEKSNVVVYLSPEGLCGDVMRNIDAQLSSKTLPLLCTDTGALGGRSSVVMKQINEATAAFVVEDGANLVVFLRWLCQTLPYACTLSDENREQIAKAIAHKPCDILVYEELKIAKSLISNLSIFQKLTWEETNDAVSPTVTWTSLSSCGTSVGLLDDTTQFPDIPGVQFLVARPSSHQHQLLTHWELASCLQPVDVIQNHIVPAWKDGISESWSIICKQQVSAYIFKNFSSLSLETQMSLQNIPIVPVAKLGLKGGPTSKFACAAELIDPCVLELAKLCFDQEEIVPNDDFFREFRVALIGCGVKTSIDETVIRHRVLSYASGRYPPTEVTTRANLLLKSSCRWSTSTELPEDSEIRSLAWLPTTNMDGRQSFQNSFQCRRMGDWVLVGSQMPTLTVAISGEWQSRLGWQNVLPARVLLAQLKYAILQTSPRIVDAVISYIQSNNLAEQVESELKLLRCIVVRNDFFVDPSQAFRPSRLRSQGCHQLQPYFANVDDTFWQKHEKLLVQIGVREEPKPEDLRKLQGALEAKGRLDDHDIGVAIEILKLASVFPRDELQGFKILGASGKFYDFGEIYYNDLGSLRVKEDVQLTHPDIPVQIIKRLRIDSLSARRVRGVLEIEDENEDEFDQQENATTRISDTLERYTIESTFREYLANADDTEGASMISWVLDDRKHPSRTLITPEMEELQGPALLVYNNGVFTEKNFDGFKNVGEGSKMHSKGSIGQFGRGSQTMFHFTDYPMILSGDFLLILDPQQEILPLNQTKGRRKPGIKLKLSKIREICPDQLIPFAGFFKYELDIDHFPGTIFRFPLITTNSTGFLRASKRGLNQNEVLRLMDTYFDEARTSLLFLRRIRSINFYVHGKPELGWAITSNSLLKRLPDSSSRVSQSLVCSATKHNESGNTRLSNKDTWLVSLRNLPSDIHRAPPSSKRIAKTVECGIAALIKSEIKGDAVAGTLATSIEPRMFNTLPLPIASDLPVHLHASFSLSGDRKSITLEEYGSTSTGAELNRHLLQSALPKLYLEHLSDLVEITHEGCFQFWPQIEPPKKSFGLQVFEAFWSELPSFPSSILPKARVARTGKCGKKQTIKMQRAVFDFLPKRQSDILLKLLLDLGVDLIREIPIPIAKRLQLIPDLKQINGSVLRGLLKSDHCGPKLLKATKADPSVWRELFAIIDPQSNQDDLMDMDGCHVLPLEDGTLGKLQLVEANETTVYYLASQKELGIFDFASSKLVSLRNELLLLTGHKTFNLKRLQLNHFEEILKLRPNVTTPDLETDAWLRKFWEFLHKDHAAMKQTDIGNYDTKLYKATYDEANHYLTPGEFDKFPAVVIPAILEHKTLCQQIPGLYLVDSTTIPKSLAQEEKSLAYGPSFSRLIRALGILGSHSGLGTFITTHVDHPSLQTLQNLVVEHVCCPYSQTSDLHAYLKLLPLWPSFVNSPASAMVPANTALMAMTKFSELLVPWMKSSTQFVDPKFFDPTISLRRHECLSILGVCSLFGDVLLRDHVFPIPANVGHTHWQDYKSLIAVIERLGLWRWDVLKSHKFGIDGNLMLKKVAELYDHSNDLFKAAFSQETNARFVHTDLRHHRILWIACGLRHEANNFVDPGHYRECLQVMASRGKTSRNMDATYNQDVQVVLRPVTTNNQRLARFNTVDWQAIAKQQVFQSRTNFNGEPEYRRDSMTEVAKGKPMQCLSDLVSQHYMPVCWSQVPFALHEPTTEAFSKVIGEGKPPVSFVWRHLQFLKAMSQRLKPFQVQDFLGDLKKTYQYLQDCLDQSTASFNLADNAVWLNMNDWSQHSVLIGDLRSSWQSIDQLVLSSSVDSGPIKAVRPGLMVYEKLLRGLGCKSITYPTVTQPPPAEGYSIAVSARQLRQAGKMFDISYQSQGQTIQAHKFVLAAVSDHCASQFGGSWTIDPVVIFDAVADPDAFLSYRTLEIMIDYAYEEPINWTEMEVLDSDSLAEKTTKLDKLLNLCKGADYWIIRSLLSQAESRLLAAGRMFIDLDNVVDVKDRALLSGAKHFHKLCEEFIDQNRDAVARAHSEERA